jgi:hypothetical protein
MTVQWKEAGAQSLAQTVALLAPEVGEALLPLARRQWLAERCGYLPALLDGLLEFPLDAGAEGAMLKQRIGRGGAEVDVLHRFLAEAHEWPFSHAISEPLAKLLQLWQKPSSALHDRVLEMSLAYAFEPEAAGDGLPTITPSLSIGLSQSLIAPDERWVAIQSVLDMMLAGQWRVWHDTLLRTLVASPPRAYVSHIDVAWRGSGPTLCVEVKRLRGQSVARYLDMVEWPGESAAVLAEIEHLSCFADHSALRLEVGREISPRLGFDCHLISQTPTESRWASLLDDLVMQGLCSRAKRDAFLCWAGMTTPLLTDLDWPDRLIVESLGHPANYLSVIHRRFGHISLEFGENGELSASGALRFVPQWLRM